MIRVLDDCPLPPSPTPREKRASQRTARTFWPATGAIMGAPALVPRRLFFFPFFPFFFAPALWPPGAARALGWGRAAAAAWTFVGPAPSDRGALSGTGLLVQSPRTPRGVHQTSLGVSASSGLAASSGGDRRSGAKVTVFTEAVDSPLISATAGAGTSGVSPASASAVAEIK